MLSHPLVILGIQKEGNFAAVMEKSHLDGAVRQFVHCQEKRLVFIAVIFDKCLAVRVNALQFHHNIFAVYINSNLRVNGQINGGVRCTSHTELEQGKDKENQAGRCCSQ